jgi:hypothetical protein
MKNAPVKKIELSESVSNLLLVSSVMLAFTPFLLGDRLILIVTGAMKEGAVMIDQFGTFLTKLVS